MKPVFVIVPVYNQDPILLKKCIDSILLQTYSNIIIVCVNDGSTNLETCRVLDKYKDMENFRLLLKNNGGVGSARNTGLSFVEKTSDSYFTFVDSDDWIDKQYIETMVKQLLVDRSDAICSSYVIEKDSNKYIWKNKVNKKILSGYEAVKETIIGNISPNPFAKLYKTELFRGGGFRYDENLYVAEDVAFTFRTFLKTKTVSISNYCGYYFNRLSQYSSLSRQKWDNKRSLAVFRCDRLRSSFICDSFSETENQQIMQILRNDCADNYLGVLPRFNFTEATESELQQLKNYQIYIEKIKLIPMFQPYSIKTRLKKYFYLYFRSLYKPIYKILMH